MQIQGYHATNHNLDPLDYNKLLQNINDHKNGALGLWCATKSDWIKPFGKDTYQVIIEGSNYDMSIDELGEYSRKYESVEEYTAKRNELLSQGYDIIRIIESHGQCDMFIVLSFEKAKVSLLK